MDPITLTLVLSSLVASAVPAIATALAQRFPGVARMIAKVLRIEPGDETKRGARSYEDQVSALAVALRQSGDETARLLSEMEEVARDRLEAVTLLEDQLRDLETREQEASARLQRLQAVEPEVARDFTAAVSQLVESGEHSSRRRDYMLFLAGVFVSLVTFLVGLWLAG